MLLSGIGARLLRLAGRLQGEEGQALAEHSLVLSLLAVLSIGSLMALGLVIASQLGGS